MKYRKDPLINDPLSKDMCLLTYILMMILMMFLLRVSCGANRWQSASGSTYSLLTGCYFILMNEILLINENEMMKKKTGS